jgi:3'(2'), 5'-bisphosphate nucleotidase
MPLSRRAAELAQIAFEAGALILRHYKDGTEARVKKDNSPVTLADEEAEALILARLAEMFPYIPIVAEEAMASGAAPIIGEIFFLVDPLDGTKEFLARNGEFTVNIALMENLAPVCGVVFAPALGRGFVGDVNQGVAFELAADETGFVLDGAKAISARAIPIEGATAITSRSHQDAKTEAYLAGFKIADRVTAGSSLKFCLVANGEADLYPRFGRTMEWDVAAGHAVLAAAGGSVTNIDGSPFRYGKIEDGFANPSFIARGLT